MHRVLFVLLCSCGAREQTPVDYGPPPVPIDPIACPASTLERFATRVGSSVSIATEQIVDAARIDKVPCKPGEADKDCLDRARKRPLPSSYEVSSIKIGAEITTVDFSYELDGRIRSDQAPSPAEMATKLKGLQSAGHKVVVLNVASADDATSRHAAISYRGVGGRQRRIGTVRVPGDTDVHSAVEDIEIRGLETAETGELVVTITCRGA